MMNVASQSSGGRSRSRSRSQSVRTVRTRTVATVPRSIRYNGINRITRIASSNSEWVLSPATGYAIGLSQYSDFGFSVSPTGFSIVGSSVNFSTTNWPGATELSNMYELMKIDKVEITFSVRQDPPAIVSGAPPAGIPTIYCAVDVNDLASGSLAQTQQQEGCRLLTPIPGKPAKFTFTPKYQQIIAYTSVANGATPRTGFVPTSLDIPHYGVRCSVDFPGGVGRHILSYSVKAWMSLKDIK